MRRILFFLVVALTFSTLQSCKSINFGLEYNVQITGDGDGDFKVTFPQGYYAMDGKASLDLTLGDTLQFMQGYTTKAEVLERNKAKELKALKAVNDSIANQFEAFAGEGTYDLWINGIVTETATGLSFCIKKHLTNRDAELRKTSQLNQSELYPFVE